MAQEASIRGSAGCAACAAHGARARQKSEPPAGVGRRQKQRAAENAAHASDPARKQDERRRGQPDHCAAQ
jgi:hypothetical protein